MEYITLEDLLLFNRNKFFWGGEHKVITKTIIPRNDFTLFYVCKMFMAIAFLCTNAVEAIFLFCPSSTVICSFRLAILMPTVEKLEKCYFSNSSFPYLISNYLFQFEL